LLLNLSKTPLSSSQNVLPATWKVEIKRIVVQGHAKKKVRSGGTQLLWES
jgi:hypothetical protein